MFCGDYFLWEAILLLAAHEKLRKGTNLQIYRLLVYIVTMRHGRWVRFAQKSTAHWCIWVWKIKRCRDRQWKKEWHRERERQTDRWRERREGERGNERQRYSKTTCGISFTVIGGNWVTSRNLNFAIYFALCDPNEPYLRHMRPLILHKNSAL